MLAKANIPDDPFAFSPMGRHIAKLNLEYISTLKEKKSNLILVTALTPIQSQKERQQLQIHYVV